MATSSHIAVVDCHHHLWDPGENPTYPWLLDAWAAGAPPDGRPPCTYSTADYLRDMRSVNLVASIHVEAGWMGSDPCGETTWLAGQIASTGWPSAAIAYADLAADNVEAVLAWQSEFGFVRGIRMRLAEHHRSLLALGIGDNPMVDPRWRNGFSRLARHQFSFELQVAPRIMPDAAALADAFPDTTIIVSHLGFPMDRSPEGLAYWRNALGELARRENIMVKLSGLSMMGLWPSARDVSTVIDHAVNVFGPSRVMFGTNFPIDLKNLSPKAHLQRHVDIVQKFSTDEAGSMLHLNAVRAYRL
jgi:predicted TIM-barrel fold metal-dependent hydrolase